MDFQTKRKNKRMLILYTKITGYCILTFLLGFILIMAFHKYIPDVVRYILGGIVICSPFVGLILGVMGQSHQYTLLRYSRNIREYRTRKLFILCHKLILEGKYREAVDIYNQMPNNSDMKNFLEAYLICHLVNSDDFELNEMGNMHIKQILELHNPDKINF